MEMVGIRNDKVFFKIDGITHNRSYKVEGSKYTFKFKKDSFAISSDGKKIESSNGTQITKASKGLGPMQSEFSINQRFGFLETFTEMVLNRITASEIVTGEGGLGKTSTVLKMLEKQGLKEDVDYVMIKGYSTPKALYATLWENKDKIVIFDDCDSVLKDPTSVNILKGALDSYEKRTVSWLTRGFVDDGLPGSFEFTGNIIFISNLDAEKIDKAVRSRSITIDLSMTLADKIERMQSILKDILPEFEMSVKQEVLDYMSEHAEEAVEFNMRTLMKCIRVRVVYGKSTEWKDAVKYLLTNV